MIYEYGDKIVELLKVAEEKNKDVIDLLAQKVAENIENDKVIHTFGTGHSHMLGIELFARAGGLGNVDAMLDPDTLTSFGAQRSGAMEKTPGVSDVIYDSYNIEKGDMMIITSNSGRNAVPVGLAVEARKRGTRVIALTSLQHSSSVSSRSPRGIRLFEAADLVLDNCGIPGDASVEFSDGRRVGPTRTAVGAALLQAVVCRVKEKAMEEGVDAEFFVSSNVDGGDAVNDLLVEKYGGEIPGLK